MANNMQSKDFLVGATIGGLLGTVAALLVAPKSGKKLRQDLCDFCYDVKEKTQDLTEQVSQKGKCLTKQAKCQANGWSHYFKDMVSEEENQETVRDLLIGGLTGGVIGTAAGLLLAPKSGEELRQNIADGYQDISEKTQEMTNQLTKQGKTTVKKVKKQANNWIDLAKDVLEQFTENAQDTGEDLIDRGRTFLEDRGFNNVAEWASIGLRVWQHLNKKR
jgi:gas vesicle protein